METKSVLYQFVRVPYTRRVLQQYDLRGIIIGFAISHDCIRARVFDLVTREVVIVSFDDCAWTPPENVLHGLRGLWATHPEFGSGVICEERRPRDMLLVRLQQPVQGRVSEFFPLTAVAVCALPPK